MYWGKQDDEGRDFREPGRGWSRSDSGRDWRNEGERDWEREGRRWRREPRDWGREESRSDPGRDWLREARDWWSRTMGGRERDWEREERRREEWPGPESWQRGPHAGPGREYREQEWRPPAYGAADYGRQGWSYGAPGEWRRRELRHRERGGEDWGGGWAGWTRARGFEGRAPKGYKRSDKRIMEDVCDELMINDRLDPSEIEVEVLDGVVILRGSVNRRHEKYLAEDIADSILGVKDVENQIRIAPREGVQHEAAQPAEAQPTGGTPVSG